MRRFFHNLKEGPQKRVKLRCVKLRERELPCGWTVFFSFPTRSRAVRKQSRTHRLPTGELQRMHNAANHSRCTVQHVDIGAADKRALAKNRRHWRRRVSPNCARSKLTLTCTYAPTHDRDHMVNATSSSGNAFRLPVQKGIASIHKNLYRTEKLSTSRAPNATRT